MKQERLTIEELRANQLDFERPPVNEVVLTVVFQPLNRLTLSDFNKIWEQFRNYGFIDIAEHAEIPTIIEKFPRVIEGPNIKVSETVSPIRILIANQDRTHILQVQRDRFTFTWRKHDESQDYPGFLNIFESFKSFYLQFREIISAIGLGLLQPIQYELTYFDHILQEEGWNKLEDIVKIYDVFTDSQKLMEFWEDIESVIFHTSFPVMDMRSRLHVAISSQIKMPEQKPTLQTEFVIRGFPIDTTLTIDDWFNLAHEQITRKFSCVFTEDTQINLWRRK